MYFQITLTYYELLPAKKKYIAEWLDKNNVDGALEGILIEGIQFNCLRRGTCQLQSRCRTGSLCQGQGDGVFH